MNDELNNTKGFFKTLSDMLHYFVKDVASDNFVLLFQIALKFILLFGILIIFNFLLKITLRGAHLLFSRKYEKDPIVLALYQSKVINSIANFTALFITKQLIETIFYRHPKSYVFLERLFYVLMIIAGWILYKRILKSIEKYFILKEDYYKITGHRAITQSLKIIEAIIFVFLIITTIFGISPSTILGSLTAMTAIIVLVFRDTILGIVTGIHVSTSKNLKVGDWIGIPKYNIEGNVQDISLLTTKIQNFDKTISTIPTYDLLSTEIRNHQIMYDGSSRRIKRSIYFNIKSFKFVDDAFAKKIKDVNLISEYLERKLKEIEDSKKNISNAGRIINGQQLTNIGLFRNYVYNYLKTNPRVDEEDIVMVRQLEITPQGLPLEIYCFANKAELVDYEKIQADIFDHILTAAQEFDLEIMQVNKI
ncbi:MAG: mechanosensitive ion channel [Bacteroidetes bacterium]|nr:mechanosensitive ion channel [Bacteroidota bacterium]